MKYYVIGDLHGRYDLLSAGLSKIGEHTRANEGEHKIIYLGDYIDRGPDSKKIIDTLMALNTDTVICLQGNHEAMAVESILRSLQPEWWLGNGGASTLISYGHPEVRSFDEIMYSYVPQEHVKWMASLPLFYEAEKQVFVHAGIPQWDINLPPKSGSPKGDMNLHKMQWMLYHPADHGGWKGKHVVHGHHQFADGPHVWNPGSRGGGRTNLDVWAYKTGRSVIGVFDDTQLTALEFLEVKA